MFPGRLHIDGFINYVSSKIFKFISGYTQSDLEGVLTRCTEGGDPGQIASAGRKIMENRRFDLLVWHMAYRFLVLKAYDLLRRQREKIDEYLPEIPLEVILLQRNHQERFYDIVNCLGFLDREHSKRLISQAADEASWDRDFMKKVLGRLVFEDLYQKGWQYIPFRIIWK